MYLVGLTGGIGSGKSLAAQMFEALGVPVIDTDAISHALTARGQPVLRAIIAEFGQHYLQPDQSLDRAKLRQTVFADAAARKRLEAILHPAIYDAALQAVGQHAGAPYAVIVVPLLFESARYLELVDRTLLIDCAEDIQVERTVARNGLSPEEVRDIMRAQLSRTERRRRADDIIVNNGSIDELRQKIAEIHKKYMQACIVSE